MGELIAFILYFAVVLIIGLYFFKRGQQGADGYFLGGRQMNKWVVAISAQASDMSGWLLMGLPGSLYALGMGQVWVAVGLAIGTYLNWLFTAQRLRCFTEVAGNSITIPEYLQNRFKTTSKALRIISAIVFFICFTVYAASAFKAGGAVFSTVFNISFSTATIIFALIVVAYTFLGGFAAVCWTDFVQGMLMLIAILAAPIAAYYAIGSIDPTFYTNIDPHFLNPLPDGSVSYASVATIVSGLAWGLGYFGMPHILVRFMSIKTPDEIKTSRRVATVWVILALGGAVAVGLIGRAFIPGLDNSEMVFVDMVRVLFPPFIAGILLSAIIAASMSTADSQLLVASSAFTTDVYKAVIRKDASDKEISWLGRAVVLVISVVAFFMAINPNSGNIMSLVSNAWAGFGASFGPVILLSLYWRRLTNRGAVLGVVFGGLTVILWIYFGLSTSTMIYELLPGFIMGLLGAVIGSLTDKEPSQEVLAMFDKASKMKL